MKYYLLFLSLISFSAYSQMYSIPTDGKPLTVTTCSGKVYDNGGYGKVLPDVDGTITIMPKEKGKIIKLVIDTLSIWMEDTLYIYQGPLKSKAALIDLPKFVFPNNSPVYYGNEKDGSITIQYKSKKNIYGSSNGLVASITCIDKKVAFDFAPSYYTVSKSSNNKISLSFQLKAQTEKAPAFKVNVYYSKDKVIDKTDILGNPIFISNLGTYDSNFSADLEVPSAVKAGDYYIIAQFDPGNAITETNEKNNVVVSELFKIEK